MASGHAPICQGPDPEPRRPRISVPPGACDTHAHVFGPLDRYPLIDDRTYTPPEAPLSAYRRLLNILGVERAVLVQPSVYGTDNSAMLDALTAAGDAFRGIAVVDYGVSDKQLRALHRVGVRGIRVNLLYKGGISLTMLGRLADKIKGLGWHIQLLIDVSDCPEFWRIADKLPVDVVIDHMGHMAASKGVDDPGFRSLLSLVAEGKAWVKLSGPYRMTARGHTPYADVAGLARALIETAPDRMVWASDWPHPFVQIAMPNDGELLDMLAMWAPDPATRAKILVDNPAKLYGFK
jgi:predicted TIM-barrel fold metal-dependent hydrolase